MAFEEMGGDNWIEMPSATIVGSENPCLDPALYRWR